MTHDIFIVAMGLSQIVALITAAIDGYQSNYQRATFFLAAAIYLRLMMGDA